MKQVKRFYFSIAFYMLVFIFTFYTLKYFMADAAQVSFLLATTYFILLFVRKSRLVPLPNFLHAGAGFYLGFAWVGFVTTIILNLFATFIPITQDERFLGLIFAAIIVIAAAVNNKLFSTKVFEIKSKKVKKSVRVAQISDLHITGPHSKTRFEHVFSRVLAENPDVIVICGDLVDVPKVPKAECFDMLYQIKTPILFVTGNHDYYADVKYVEKLLKERGVFVLRGQQKEVCGITFTGIDDPTGKVSLAKSLEKIELDKRKFNVLLYHQPKYVELAAEKGFDLMLSGHTHAGQLYPFNYVVRLQFKYVVGLHKIEKMQLYVNPGTGTWEIPMRIGSKNTIALFEFKPR